MNSVPLSSLAPALPEIVLALGASALLLVPVAGARGEGRSARTWTLVILAITAGSVIACSHAVSRIDPLGPRRLSSR